MADQLRIRIWSARCVYCGEPADSDEHFPPQSHSDHGYILRACVECNTIATDKWPDLFDKRVAYVKAQLRKRNAKLLRTPEWTTDELSALGHGLRTEVLRCLPRLATIKQRLAWNAAAYIASVDHSSVFVPESVDRKTIESASLNWSGAPAAPRQSVSLCVHCERPARKRFCSPQCAERHRLASFPARYPLIPARLKSNVRKMLYGRPRPRPLLTINARF